MSRFLDSLLEYKYFILLVLAVVAFLMLYVDPTFLVGETQEFKVVDICGLGPGSLGIEHTIGGVESCEGQCFGKCESEDMNYKDVEFVLKGEGTCHTCTCFCR